MADSSIPSKSLEQLEREITCGVCQEHYTDPKILPCLHYYCKKCVLDLAQKARPSKSFPCPECRNKATLPEEGVDGLKTALFQPPEVHRIFREDIPWTGGGLM